MFLLVSVNIPTILILFFINFVVVSCRLIFSLLTLPKKQPFADVFQNKCSHLRCVCLIKPEGLNFKEQLFLWNTSGGCFCAVLNTAKAKSYEKSHCPIKDSSVEFLSTAFPNI